jgi:glycosyltransferase involved in cell wall biosynthesis
VFITNNLLVEHFEKGCDIFLYNRILPSHCDEQIAALKKTYGFKTVVDIDDYWELDKHHVLHEVYQVDQFAFHQIRHIVDADAVLTTHERLADEIREYNRVVYVCPNAIPKQGQFDIVHEPYHLVRFFWQGSDTHKEDIGILERPIEMLGKLSPKIKMIMAGYAEESPSWGPMLEAYTAKLKHQYEIIPYSPITDYYKHYAKADVCLVPLCNSRFNRMKSNLKILEAANMSLPVIASAVHPYLEMPVNYCRSGRDWVGHIKRLTEWPMQRREEGQRLAEFCWRHYNFQTINNERRQALEYVASKSLT